jgi:serine/threonine-protein kinase
MRVLPRVRADVEGAIVVELRAGDSLAVSIHDPRRGVPTTLALPLAVGDVELAADAAATAIAELVAGDPRRAYDARELLLRARLVARRGFEGVNTAFDLLQRAHALDPDDPRISAMLAMMVVRFSVIGPNSPDDLSRVRELVRGALATAPELAETHIAAGHLVLHTGEPAVAAAHFRTAIACSPYAAEAHESLGRMLMEAGFLDVGSARLDDALAIAPELVGVRWEIARAAALERRWDVHDMHVAALAREDDRPLARVRFAWWRGEFDSVRSVRTWFDRPTLVDSYLFTRLLSSLLDGAWPRHRDDLVRYVQGVVSHSGRRHAFLAQLVAEAAGYLGDHAVCTTMIDHAIVHGLFDLHWFDRCPNLDRYRDTSDGERLRERIEKRANAILDALYGDADPGSLLETVVSR